MDTVIPWARDQFIYPEGTLGTYRLEIFNGDQKTGYYNEISGDMIEKYIAMINLRYVQYTEEVARFNELASDYNQAVLLYQNNG